MSITIEEKDRNFIYSIIGYPNIELEDTGLMTDEILDDYVIEPSLIEYYRWFPIHEIVNTTISSGNTSTTIPFPDDTEDMFTYNVADCRLAQLQDTNIYSSGQNITNPFMQFRNISQSLSGRFGSRYDYGFSEIQGSTNFGNDARLNQTQVFYNKVDEINREVQIFSQNPGVVQTTFAKYSTNVNYVNYANKREFLNLCRGELLLYWANNLKRINSEFPISFNVDELVTDGEDLIDKTLESWKGKSKVMLIRS